MVVNAARLRVPHAHRHLERQFHQAANREPDRLAARSGSPTSFACRKPRPSMRPFRGEPIEALGYNVAVHGQKTFNGVAILSKFKFDEVTPRLPGDDADDHARFIEATVSTDAGALRVASIYLPNGNPPGTEKYPYKIRWMERLFNYAHERLQLEEPLVMAGDYNVIPTADDVHNPAVWADRRAVPAADPRQVPRADQPWPDRRDPRGQRRSRPLHLLGLSGGRLAEELGHPDRPSAAVAAGRRPAHRRRHRQARALLGAAVRSRAGLCRSGDRLRRCCCGTA